MQPCTIQPVQSGVVYLNNQKTNYYNRVRRRNIFKLRIQGCQINVFSIACLESRWGAIKEISKLPSKMVTSVCFLFLFMQYNIVLFSICNLKFSSYKSHIIVIKLRTTDYILIEVVNCSLLLISLVCAEHFQLLACFSQTAYKMSNEGK